VGILAIVALSACASAAPPSAVIAAPLNGSAFDAGQTIVFSANGSFDPDYSNATLLYRWNFAGDLVEGTNQRVVFYNNFTVPGTFRVGLTVVDNESLEGYANVTVTIRPPNQPPIAVIASPAEGSRHFTDQFINFSGVGSSDPEGSPLAFFWFTNRSGQFGTNENLSVRLAAGDHIITLRVVDDRGAQATASVSIHVEVNLPPRVAAIAVTPEVAFAGDPFVFTATYFEDNGEIPASVLLILDGTPNVMSQVGGSDPSAGLQFALSLNPQGGRHTFYVFASDGNYSNLSATFVGPDVWTNVSVVSADGLATIAFQALGPANISVAPYGGVLPIDPPGLVAVSVAYRVNATFLSASNFSMAIAFGPSSQIDRNSALVYRADTGASAWTALVTQVDVASNTASIPPGAGDLPGLFRVFARRSAPPMNAAPALVITVVGQAHPNSTLLFDGANSTDPEGATVLLAWRFEGPGLATPWIPGSAVLVAFPQVGLYAVSLQGEDGSGNVVYQNMSVEVSEVPPPPVENPYEAEALVTLAVAVVAAGVLSRWWRGRRPARKPAYDDLYGQAYKRRLTDEREYTQLFERFAAPEGEAPPVDEPPREP
jgi:hypothetical protein